MNRLTLIFPASLAPWLCCCSEKADSGASASERSAKTEDTQTIDELISEAAGVNQDFINYGKPIEVTATSETGSPVTLVLTD